MRVTISRKEVLKVAALAKLEFDENALAEMARDLEQIVGYVEKLQELDVDDVPETAHVLPLVNVLREDASEPWLTNEEALANAPQRRDGFFSVPKVIG